MIRTDRTYCSVKCARRARVANAREWTKTVVSGDWHIPFHCNEALNLFFAFIEKEKPDRIILNGDVADNYEISKFTRDPQRKADLRDEVKEVRDWLYRLRGIAGKCEIIYICGNHEHRLHKYILTNAKELAGLDGLTLPAQYHLDKLRIKWVPCEADRFVDTYYALPNLLVGHFDKTSAHSAYAAKLLLDSYGISLIQAHVHSFGATNRTLAGGMVAAWEGGCLCDLQPHYCRPKNWAHGFHVIHHRSDGYFSLEPVLMVDHKFRYGGTLYQGGVR